MEWLKKNDNGSSSLGCLIVLAILCLAALFLAFGWIAGVVWLLFFRKRMRKDPSTQKKYTIGVSVASVLSFMIFIYSMVSAPTPLTALSLSANINESELEINNDYTLHLQYEPDDASLSDITYKIDNPFRASIQTDPNDPASLILHTNLEGDINITAKKGDIESNVLSFTIIDSSKIKYEEAELAKAEEEKQRATEEKATKEAEQEDEGPLGFNVMFSKTYRNDVTGNWRLARIAEDINIEEYAADYYKNYFEDDNEIHIIINFSLNTTTRITVMGNILDVAVMDYTDKEEHDAAIACSGTLLNEYRVNIDTGKIERLSVTGTENETAQEKTTEVSANFETTQHSEDATQEAEQPEQVEPESVPQNSSSSTGDNNNFDTYNNTDQQETSASYVLNTSTHKIHYPGCSSVPKIAPQNYATSNSSVEELLNQGYTTCGRCF